MGIKLPFFSGKELVGIDLGTQFIKVVQLKKTKNSYLIQNAGKAILNSENVAEISMEERANLQSASLEQLLKTLKIKPSLCATSVSGNSVIVRFIKPLKMSKEEMAKTIQFEAEPNIPFNIAEVSLSFQILGDLMEDGQKKMETILVAAKNDLIQNRVEVLSRSGIKPMVIDVDSFSLNNIYEESSLIPEESVLFVNIGAQTTNLIIIESGTIKMERNIFIAGINFSKALQKNLQITFSASEELKKKYGLKCITEDELQAASGLSEEEYQVTAILLPSVRELLVEIQRSISYYQALAGEKTINRILISGGTANLKNIDKFFTNELRIPVEYFDPFAKFAFAPGVSQPDFPPEYSVACGLALRKTE